MGKLRAAGLLLIALVLAVPAHVTGAAPIYPILSGSGLLLGGTAAGRWVDAATTARQLRGGEAYRLYALGSYLGKAVGTKPSGAEPCGDTLAVDVTPNLGATTLAVGGTWNVLPRPITRFSAASTVYRAAVAEVLKQNGVGKSLVVLTQVLRTDVDGDGVNEVLITATRLAKGTRVPEAEAGDYSVVLMRKVVAGKVVTTIITAQFFPRARPEVDPRTYTMGAVADLNGDGKLEVIVDSVQRDEIGTTVYRIVGTQSQTVLETGCGV